MRKNAWKALLQSQEAPQIVWEKKRSDKKKGK